MSDHIPDTGNKVAQLTTYLEQIEAAGGPKFRSDIDLDNLTISDTGDGTQRSCSPGTVVYNPGVCEDGVFAYQESLNEWLFPQSIGRVEVSSNYGFERELFGLYTWSFYHAVSDESVRGHTNDRLEASIALIKAVAERVGVKL